MTPQELRARASKEVDDLGLPPADWRARIRWLEEWNQTVVLLARLADWEAAVLRRAAFETAPERADSRTRDLLLDAADECEPPGATGAP